jgi:hypothetical protein
MMPPNDFGEMILNAFGVKDKNVRALTLTIEAGRTPILTVQRYVGCPKDFEETFDAFVSERYSLVPLTEKDFIPRVS